MRDRLLLFYKETGRKPYINYCVTENNHTDKHIEKMLDLFSPTAFCFTFSTICNADKNSEEDQTDYSGLQQIQNVFLQRQSGRLRLFHVPNFANSFAAKVVYPLKLLCLDAILLSLKSTNFLFGLYAHLFRLYQK